MKAKQLAELLEVIVRKVVREELKPIITEIKRASKPLIKETKSKSKTVKDPLDIDLSEIKGLTAAAIMLELVIGSSPCNKTTMSIFLFVCFFITIRASYTYVFFLLDESLSLPKINLIQKIGTDKSLLRSNSNHF